MNKLTKEKQLHLVLVGIVTVGVIAGLWFGLITMQKGKLREIASKNASLQHDIEKMHKVIVGAVDVQQELGGATNKLVIIESEMPLASGDLFSWIVTSIKKFNVPGYKVDMPQISTPVVSDVRMFAGFPYNQAVVTVSGSAYYYEFGKFLADLENHFPYLRVQNLNLEPGFGTTADEKEKLSFRMELVTLVKPVSH
jgi:hypothetical protein